MTNIPNHFLYIGHFVALNELIKIDGGVTFHNRKLSRDLTPTYDNVSTQEEFGKDFYKHMSMDGEVQSAHEEDDYQIGTVSSTTKRKGAGIGLLRCIAKKGNNLLPSSVHQDPKERVILTMDGSTDADKCIGIKRSISTPDITSRSRKEPQKNSLIMDVDGSLTTAKLDTGRRKSET